MNALLIKNTAKFIGRIALSAGVGVVMANVINKATTAVTTEYKCYRAYRAAHKGKEHKQ